MEEEQIYLEKTQNFIREEIVRIQNTLSEKKSQLIDSGREMWEDHVHSTEDFEKLVDMNQQLNLVTNLAAGYENTLRQIEKLTQMIENPYFGRFDFIEDGYEDRDKIYIGLHNVMDQHTHEIYVYDWRAPISSIFYRCEPGPATYEALNKTIRGNVLLKRQYRILRGQLKYFFDCSIRINDEMLQEVLSHNASSKMKNIVETIQREQDIIIRDTTHDLLIVQGVAGSGKTSVALHRIAFLLYQSMKAENILIISPNDLFSRYIGDVLPELGEDNVERMTFDDMIGRILPNHMFLESRINQLESLIYHREKLHTDLRRQTVEFMGSCVFIKLLDRLVNHVQRHMIPFEDVYFEGKVLFSREELKQRFLNNKTNIPAALHLKRIEKFIIDAVHPLRRKRLEKIKTVVANNPEHQFEIFTFSRYLSLKEAKRFSTRLKGFTNIDILRIYRRLFENPDLFFRLAKGLPLPDTIHTLLADKQKSLTDGQIRHEDTMALLYLRLKLEGCDAFPSIRHVVVDEAQDYSPLCYHILKTLFKDARFTVLGDINQTIEKVADRGLYEEIARILEKRTSSIVTMNRSYRASFEINAFCRRLLGNNVDMVAFERHESEPSVISSIDQIQTNLAIIKEIPILQQDGLESIVILCKTQQEAVMIYSRLKTHLELRLVDCEGLETGKGISVMPIYLSKGLEFDAVIVYDAGRTSYCDEADRKLLYIACTRAMHRLTIYYTGEKSPFL